MGHAATTHLVVEPTPLKNDGVKVTWDDFPFPTDFGTSLK